MRKQFSNCVACSLLAVMMACFWASPAVAQFRGGGGSLGGYGASSASSGPVMGGGGSMVIPYGGKTEGFMPGSMGGGSSLSFQERRSETMIPSRASSSFAPMFGGMGRGSGSRSSMANTMTSRGISSGGSSFRLGSGGRGMGVMTPSIGYPFRQPPSLLSPSSGGAGMSM